MSIEIKTNQYQRDRPPRKVITIEEIANSPTDVDADYLSSQAFEARKV